ncbi:metalloregulator ArsR/SmtB family transcription factor [Serpentinicella sp. ANB-PHB4]|uniref:ArsR/SmtB family transcription factor n=1 Tax=Serpentinicella sp. ANB-PHB4 TaxID=3074076 RepID=UPI0028559EE9|nr:metalloregulator ArsR/SmtB family transcription factor [Serpentinicella sp. ANB-PHB4]MDR5659511.1 metalloregulator ArsR/SmtB family transcription factor [Serpentinicella sp. ANB-PHB4]
MKEYVEIFKALADENRLKILQIISGAEHCACDIQDQLNLTQPTISHHMKVLQQVGVVNVRKSGRWMHYSINKEKLALVWHFINDNLVNNLNNNIVVSKKECE